MNITTGQLAALVGGELYGDLDKVVCGVGSVDDADCEDVVLAADDRYLKRAMASAACCVVVADDMDCDSPNKCMIKVADPDAAFARILDHFKDNEALPRVGVAAGSVVEPGAVLGKDVAVGANCYIGRGAVIADGCVLFPNVYLGENCRLGARSRLYPGVVIHSRCRIGARVVVRAGAVIGSEGFGFSRHDDGYTRLPHAGIVEIGDDVEIGANSTIDRAKTGSTVIGSGTKIDNLVHIAHNCKIGKNCMVVAQVGIAGTVTIGDNVTLGGQAGVKDHVSIADGCIIAARSGVTGSLTKSSVVSGFPARDHRLEMHIEAARLRLPDVLKRLKELENEIKVMREGEKE